MVPNIAAILQRLTSEWAVLLKPDAILAAWDEIPETDLEKVITLPKGETSPLDLASLTMSHLNYHDAQLNYVQAMSGDDKVHWESED